MKSREKLPWSPTQIAVISLVLTPLAGGILHALNYERLGAPQRKRVALLSNLIAGMAAVINPFGSVGFALFASAYFYKSQEQLFQAHRSQGGRTTPLVVPILLALGVGVMLVIGVALILAAMK